MTTLTPKQQHWQSIIDGWRESGLSQVEYCRREGIELKKFYGWKGRLKKITEPQPPKTGQFLPLEWQEKSQPEHQSSTLKLRCSNVEIEVTHQTDPELLKKTLSWLGGNHDQAQ